MRPGSGDALTLLDRVLDRLRTELVAKHKERHFEVLRDYLTGDPESPDYNNTARELGVGPAAASRPTGASSGRP
jgi:hypothetical protein